MKRPHVAALLLERRHVAESRSRGGARVGWGNAVAAIGVLAHREMEGELVVEIALEATPAEERLGSMNNGADVHVDRRWVQRRRQPSHCLTVLRRLHDAVHSGGHPTPVGGFLVELTAS